MQDPIQKFRQSSIVFKLYFAWKFETFYELQLPYNSIYFAETSHKFPTYQCLQKCVQDFQKLKRHSFHMLFYYIFINNWRSKQNKTNPEHVFLDIIK